MTTEEPKEVRSRFEVLLEDMKKEFKVLGEAQVANTQDTKQHRAESNQRFENVDREIIRLDVKNMTLDAKVEQKTNALEQKINALDAKVDALDAKVEQKIDTLDARLSAELSRIAAHLGLTSDSPPAGPP